MHSGFMVVQDTEGERKELGQIPIDDIAAVIANAHGLSYTNNLLVALSERGAPFVLCAANHNAVFFESEFCFSGSESDNSVIHQGVIVARV